jgi:hypothetical protein
MMMKRINLSISKLCYFDKDSANLSIQRERREVDGLERKTILREVYGIEDKYILLSESNITSYDCLQFLINGGTIAQCFNTPKIKSRVDKGKVTTFSYRQDGFFDFTVKANAYFKEANFIGIDIDSTNYPTARDFISMIPSELRPTFWYTTYSNMQIEDDGSPKGARFRMIYFLENPIYNIFLFKYNADKLMNLIEGYTGEIINDRCGNRVSQYFNGTCLSNEDLIIDYDHTGKIFHISDFGGTIEDYWGYLTSDKPCNYSMSYWKNPDNIKYLEETISDVNDYLFSVNNPLAMSIPKDDSIINKAPDLENSKRNIELDEFRDRLDKNFLEDLKKNDFGTEKDYGVLKKYRGYLELFYQTEIPQECNYMFAKKVPDNYFRLWYPRERLVKDRMRTILFRMVCRRFMKPSATPEEIIFNAAEDIRRFIDNGDSKFNWRTLTEKAFYVFSMTHEELWNIWGESIQSLAEQTFPKSGWVFDKGTTESQRKRFLGIQREIREIEMINEVCDESLTIKENLEILENHGLSISKKTYIKRTTKDKEKKKEEIFNLINPEKSVRENKKMLEELGYKKGISLGTIKKIIDSKKNP